MAVFSMTKMVRLRSGDVIGCSNEEPVMLVTSGSETQNINLQKGWSWISTNLRLKPASAPLNRVMTVAEPWKEGDLIKNPESRQFSTYSEVMDVFMGTLSAWDYTQTYMVYSAQDNILRLNGENLLEYEMKLTFRGSSDGSGQWSPLPFLLNRNLLYDGSSQSRSQGAIPEYRCGLRS